MTPADESNEAENGPPPRTIRVFGREFVMPRSRALRIGIGVLLVLGGIVGFLPVLGFWMIPLGIIVLSYEIAHIRRLRRRMVVRFAPRQKNRRPKT
jgi:hypothetical protein